MKKSVNMKKLFSIFVTILIVSMSFVLAALGGNTDPSHKESQSWGRLEGLKEGNYVDSNDEAFTIRIIKNRGIEIESKGIVANCNCKLNQSGVDRTALYFWKSNGKTSEIKIMPGTASEKAIERLGELGFTIELKEVGKGDGVKVVYEAKAKKQGRFLGLFKIKGEVIANIDSETGEIVSVKKPWWAFLASGI